MPVFALVDCNNFYASCAKLFRPDLKDTPVVVLSNYALYADLSSRVMRTLEEMAPRVEVYSIDEAFLDLTGIESALSLVEFGQQVRERIGHWIGITVCVGIAPTKTLAKLAHGVKNCPSLYG